MGGGSASLESEYRRLAMAIQVEGLSVAVKVVAAQTPWVHSHSEGITLWFGATTRLRFQSPLLARTLISDISHSDDKMTVLAKHTLSLDFAIQPLEVPNGVFLVRHFASCP